MEQRGALISKGEGVAVVRRYLEAARSRDVVNLGTGFDTNVIWHQPGTSSVSRTYHGLGEIFELFLNMNDLSGGTFKIDSIKDIMANGDLVIAIVEYSARRGENAITMTGADLFRMEGGKIKEVWPFSPDQAAEDRFWG